MAPSKAVISVPITDKRKYYSSAWAAAASPQACRHKRPGLGLASGIFLGRPPRTISVGGSPAPQATPTYPAPWPTSFSPSSAFQINLSHCGSMCTPYHRLRYLPEGKVFATEMLVQLTIGTVPQLRCVGKSGAMSTPSRSSSNAISREGTSSFQVSVPCFPKHLKLQAKEPHKVSNDTIRLLVNWLFKIAWAALSVVPTTADYLLPSFGEGFFRS